MRKETEKQFKKLIKLQNEIDTLLDYHADILKTSAVGQSPPVADTTLNKAISLGEKQALIWNNIRSHVTKDGKTTLWQLAFKMGYPVRRFGNEEMLNLNMTQVKKLMEVI